MVANLETRIRSMFLFCPLLFPILQMVKAEGYSDDDAKTLITRVLMPNG